MPPEMMVDLEEWMLIKADVLKYTKVEAEHLTLDKTFHFLGFTKGLRKLEEQQQQKEQKKAELDRMMRSRNGQ